MIKDFLCRLVQYSGVHMDDHDFASYYTFSLAVANDAENAQTNRVCRKDHDHLSNDRHTTVYQIWHCNVASHVTKSLEAPKNDIDLIRIASVKLRKKKLVVVKLKKETKHVAQEYELLMM